MQKAMQILIRLIAGKEKFFNVQNYIAHNKIGRYMVCIIKRRE